MFLRIIILLLLLTRMMTILPTFFREDSRRIAYKALSREPETLKIISQLTLIIIFLYFALLFR